MTDCATGCEGRVEIESEWTARKRERYDVPTVVRSYTPAKGARRAGNHGKIVGREWTSPRMKKTKINPHCPIPGCKTTQPHQDDAIVKGLIAEFGPPDKLAGWVLAAMAELRESITRDLADKRIFAWLTRLRQPEELYVRALYLLFVATEREKHHILSGEMPNGFSRLYEEVNQQVFEGRGLLQTEHLGLTFGSFTPFDTLNDGAHVSFRSFLTCIGLIKHPEYLGSDFTERYLRHLNTYCNYLNYIHEMFKGGKTKEAVLGGVKNLHKPASYWAEQQKAAKEKSATS